MGTPRTVVIAVAMLIAASAARAQSGPEPPAQPPPRPTAPPPAQEPGWLGDSLPPLWNRLYININAARQLQKGTFNSFNTFSSYGEEGSFQTAQNVGTGVMLDASAGYHLARHFAVGGGFWTAVSKSTVAGTAAIPDALFYDRYAVSTVSAQDLQQKTVGVNVMALFDVSVRNRLHLGVYIGPAVAPVSLDVRSLTFAPPATSTSNSQAPPSSSQAAPQNGLNPALVVATQTATIAKAAMAGFDVSFMFTERYGVGVLARHVAGKVNLPIAPDMKVA